MENQQRRYVGLDVHKEVVQACFINSEGKRLESHRFACTRETLLDFARQHLRQEDQVVLEATTNTWAVAALLRPHVERLVVVIPLRTRINRGGERQNRQGRCGGARATAALWIPERSLAT